ncbi:MAG: helix-turn-helix domain-containing protein [Acidimicrobiales bacterium]
MLKGARLRVGLSRTELGRRAGVNKSVVSAYESDARPSFRRQQIGTRDAPTRTCDDNGD